MIHEELKRRGLAKDTKDGVSIPIHFTVRSLDELLSVPSAPTAGHVVSFDLQTVGADLGSVSIDEIVGYRKEHYRDHRAYVLAIKQFVRELSVMPEEERTLKFAERQDILNDIAAQLRKHSEWAWRKPTSFALAMTGVVIAIGTAASPLTLGGGLARLIGSLTGGVGHEKTPTMGPYSFLFKAGDRFGF